MSVTYSQVGQTIVGATDEYIGTSVCLNSDGSIMALSSNNNSYSSVYQYNGTNWVKLGQDIYTESPLNGYVNVVSLSGSGYRIAIGALNNTSFKGSARVYDYNGSNWVQIGTDIDGEAVSDYSGYSISLSNDGSTLAILAPYNDGNGTNSGSVRVYSYNGTNWTKIGQDIDGEAANDFITLESAYNCVSLNSTGSRVAIGSYANDGTVPNSNRGSVRVYDYNGSSWVKIGQDIDGEEAGDYSGFSVSLSTDGTTVAIGAINNAGTETSSSYRGSVRVYSYNNSTSLWNKVGQDIDGLINNDRSGYIVSLNSDGTKLVVSSEGYNSGGVISVYKYNGSTWNKMFNDLTATGDYIGPLVHMAPNGNRFIVGSYITNDTTGNVKVFQITEPVTKATTTISATTPVTKTFNDASFNLNATSNNSETSITYSSSDTNVATVNSSGQVSIVGAGTTTIILSQIETTNYNAGSSTVSITVNKSNPTITATSSYTKTFGDASFNLNATSNNSETSITYSSSNTNVATVNSSGQVSIVGAGTTTIILSQIETTNYNATSSNISININIGWSQLGQDIDGEAAGDLSGISVSLSTDGTILAIGASYNDGNGTNSGSVRTYEWSNNTWTKLGNDIDGEAANDFFGASVSLSADGTILAIGAPNNDGNGTNSGSVRVYQRSNNDWTKLGNDIDGEAANDFFGASVSLSADGTILAIGASYNDGNGANSGSVRVYQWSNNAWTKLGNDIDGEASSENFGVSVSLSVDGTILAIGSMLNNYGTSLNSVRVYQWSNNAWTKLGNDINAEAAGDKFGASVSLSADGTILAIGAPNNDGNGTDCGSVRVYKWSNNAWTKLGNDIDGEAAFDSFGSTVSLSADGTILAIGASYNDGNVANSDRGSVRVYQWSNNAWTKLGNDIDGEAALDYFGGSVSLSADGTILAIGAPNNDGNGANSGSVRVYKYITSKTPTTINATSSYTKTFGDASFNLNATSNNSETSITYSSSNTNVATVNSSGQVNIVGAGTATITLQQTETNNYSSGTKNISMTVNKLTSTISSSSPISKSYGDNSFNLEFTSNNSETTYFTSTDTSVATIDENGYIILIKPGTTTIIISKLSTNNYTAETINVTLNISKTYTASQLKDLGFTATEMKNAGYTATELKSASFTATQLKAVEYSLNELVIAGYNATQLKAAEFTATELKVAEFTATQLKVAEFTASELKTAQFTASELKTAEFTASELKTAEFTATELKAAQFTASELKTAQFTASELKTAQFTATELKTAQFTASELKIAQFTVSELKNVNYLDSEILLAGFTGSELRTSGYNISELKANGYTNEEILASGYPTADLYVAGYNINQIKNTGYTDTQILTDLNTVLSIIPYPPVITSIQSDDSKVYVSFTDNINNLIPILGYKYSLNNSSDLKWFLTKQSPLTIFGLTNGQNYSIGMYSVNMNGTSSVSNIISNIMPSGIPNKPILISANLSGQILTAEFASIVSNGSVITEHYYSLDQTTYTLIEPSGNLLIIGNIQYNQNYLLSMKVKNVNGFSQISNTLNINSSIIPTAPTITNVVPSDKECLIYFSQGETYNSNLICYKYFINNDITEYIATSKSSPLTAISLINGNSYTFKIKSVTQSGESPLSNGSNSVVPYGAPLAPVITKIEPRNQSIIVHFTSNNNNLPVNGLKYAINNFEFVDIGMVTSPFTITNLINKTMYAITFYSYNNSGTSIRSNTISCISGAPTAPIINSTYVSNKNLYINYTPSEYNNGFSVTRMLYTIDNGKTNLPIDKITNPLVISKLTVGINFNLAIVSSNINGISPMSNIVENLLITDVPNKPVILSVTPLYESATTFQASVTLRPMVSNGSPITGYKYAIGSTSTTYFNVSGTTLPLIIPGLPVNTSLVIKIKAVNSVGESQESTVSRSFRYNISVPGGIVIRTITTSYELASVSFIQPSTGGSQILTYKYSLNGSNYIDLNTITLPLLIPIQNNITYNIQIVATNEIGDSTPSASLSRLVSYTYLPPLPPRITSIIPWNNSLIVNLTSSTLRGTPVTSYSYAIDSSQNIVNSNTTTSPITINGLTNGTKYNIMLYANSLAGMSNISNIVSGTPILSAPGIPLITNITPLNNSCSVAFTPPLANGTAITTYMYTLDNGITLINANTITSPFLISGLVNGTTYSIRILAVNSIGNSQLSTAKTVTPIYTVPTAPVITRLTRTSVGRATVSFTLSIPNGSTISSYYYTFDDGVTYINANKTTSPIILTGLNVGTTYSIRLAALNDLGYSPLSNSSTFTAI